MADDLFSRFKPTPAVKSDEDDSGIDFRQNRGEVTAHVSESDIMAAIATIPALPTVVNAILDKAGSDTSSAADLEALVKRDMVIAGRLLKLVNSPFYGLSQKVASIAQAVAIIGFGSLRSLVLAASVSNLLSAELEVYGFADMGLWKNSMVTAQLAREIALLAGEDAADRGEEYFVSGLLRDIGMLVLGPFLFRQGIRLRRDPNNADILRYERSAIGFDHCWVGERIAQRWLLPNRTRMCITKHHRIPTDLTSDQMRELAAVRLAERLAYNAKVGVVEDHPFETQIDGALLQAAGLDRHSFKALVDKVPRIVAAADFKSE